VLSVDGRHEFVLPDGDHPEAEPLVIHAADEGTVLGADPATWSPTGEDEVYVATGNSSAVPGFLKGKTLDHHGNEEFHLQSSTHPDKVYVLHAEADQHVDIPEPVLPHGDPKPEMLGGPDSVPDFLIPEP
jgi:hypothetical protein